MRTTYRNFINPHKVITPIFIIALIIIYDNASIGPLIYLSLHGMYCLNWMLKELMFPDKLFDEEISLKTYLLATVTVYNYWWAPWLLISRRIEPHPLVILAAVSLNILGTFLHFGCDVQKYFVLQERTGLITNGFFARSRNLNYLGEIMIYLGFAILPQHIGPLLMLSGMVLFVFVPMMLRKDRSMSRYEDFKEYKTQSNFILPKLFSC